ncbi:MAG TPA: hypothetical protein VNL71_06880, partial [Chloroflexota bacterium]|nr:hypothetical protein [Chloroflexota bacterium]
MPVAELAPSLLALGQIFHEANGLVNPAGPKVSLEVRAHEGGSFEVALALGHIEGMAGELTRV